MSRRGEIAIDDAEQRRYVAEAMTIILVSNGRDGYPHAVPMWFTVDDDGCIYMTTYGRSQKAVNLRRDPKIALLVESGQRYDQLKGVLIRGHAEVLDDLELAVRTLIRIQTKHMGALAEGVEDVMRQQARKRVVLKITPERVASWDHAKLAGRY
ncbi:MAG TPA: TIGR03618 family F420-dependent PPOX class oxidoreductase [Candidatus Binatia bacterium]